MNLYQKIKALLDEHGSVYEEKEHAPTPTSEDSARERGEPIKIGAKALLVKADDTFVLCVLPADLRLDAKKVKTFLGAKKIRFANEEELQKQTGCVKGAVPPFGNLINVQMIVDKKQFDEECLAFNAGSLEHSLKMKTADYQRIVQPTLADISEEVI